MISLREFYEKYEDKNFDVEAHVKNEINIKEQTAMIFLSSGTTGPSKGVETTCDNLFFVIDQYTTSLLNCDRFDERIIALNIAPFFHIMGFTNLFLILFSKRFCSVFLPKFDFNLFLKTIESYKVATMTIPPPVVILLAKSEITEKFILKSLKNILSGAAPLAKDVEEQILRKFPNIFIATGYGLSEANIVIYNLDLKEPMLGSIGKLMKGLHAKIIDESGKILGVNEVGEVCIKGPVIMKGYYKNTKATAATVKDGWLHTGDIGYYDKDEKFFIVDRLKELIKYKAFQVPPAELEGLLLSNPKIKDCGVIGIPDEAVGELPFAFVVKQPNVELSEDEVKNFVKENASNAKWLRGGVKFIEEIPKNPSGKILRRELRDLYKSMKAKL
jgi:acyl-CoA synthetase (AMP-forming)/AMP-acid ligase II